jgi:hypothetical protein
MIIDPNVNTQKLFSTEEIEKIKPNLDFIKRYFEYRKL